jgi:predicted glycogen debranching enzyme
MSAVDLAGVPFETLLGREWLVTNQLGGYASGTVCCTNSRKYHGLLVAAMSPPTRRVVLLSRVEDTLYVNGQISHLAASEYPGTVHPHGYRLLRAFSPEPFPRWLYQGEGWTLEKSLRLIPGRNTVCITWTLLGGDGQAELSVRPLLALRPIHELSFQWNGKLAAQKLGGQNDVSEKGQRITDGRFRVPATSRTPDVFFAHSGSLDPHGVWYLSTVYRREAERGYAGLEDLWMPGTISFTLKPGTPVHLVCSSEPVELKQVVDQLDQVEAAWALPVLGPTSDATLERLRRSSALFVTEPHVGVGASDYQWGPPSFRDAFTGYAGLFCLTGRFDAGAAALRKAASFQRGGLMPADLPEDGTPPHYGNVDVALWFAEAVAQHLRWRDDAAVARDVALPALNHTIDAYLTGVSGLVYVDEAGLLVTDAPGTAPTWMNLRYDLTGPAVTPRLGRAVELQALWHNLLLVTADLAQRFGQPARAEQLRCEAHRVRRAFADRFWNEPAGSCFDVVDDRGSDASIRPNQLLTLSLTHTILPPKLGWRMVETVRRTLLTPAGVRTLEPHDRNYCGTYRGPAHLRDRAYHNGTAFTWLLGPLARALVKLAGSSEDVRGQVIAMLQPTLARALGDGNGLIPELADGDAPHAVTGAPASALATAEVLRTYAEHVLLIAPEPADPRPIVTTEPPLGLPGQADVLPLLKSE